MLLDVERLYEREKEGTEMIRRYRTTKEQSLLHRCWPSLRDGLGDGFH